MNSGGYSDSDVKNMHCSMTVLLVDVCTKLPRWYLRWILGTIDISIDTSDGRFNHNGWTIAELAKETSYGLHDKVVSKLCPPVPGQRARKAMEGIDPYISMGRAISTWIHSLSSGCERKN